MNKNDDSDAPTPQTEGPLLHRRGFLLWSGLVAIGAACNRLLTDATDPPDVRTERIREFVNYPTPAYLPPGYTFLKEEVDRPDGFRGAGMQTALVYRGPRAPASIVPSRTRYPLLFFATKGFAQTFLGTEQNVGTEVALKLPNAVTALGTYFDGMWEPIPAYDANGNPVPGKLQVQWSRLNFHALVYQWGDFQIGIRGSRRCGVQLDELVKVASSVTVPA